MKNKIIIAHRGASAYESDNSLNSFRRALDMGADMVEFDLRKTGDGVYIGYHNNKLKGRLVSETSYKDLNKLFGRDAFQIPTVEEIIEVCGKEASFDVHLKEPEYAIEAVGLMQKLVDRNKIIVTSEHMDALRQIKNKYSALRLGYIILRENPSKFIQKLIMLRKSPQSLMEKLQREDIEFVVPYHRFIGKRLLENAKRRSFVMLMI